MISYKKVGGLHWLYVGRLCVSFYFKRTPKDRVQRKCVVVGRTLDARVVSVLRDGGRVFAVE